MNNTNKKQNYNSNYNNETNIDKSFPTYGQAYKKWLLKNNITPDVIIQANIKCIPKY